MRASFRNLIFTGGTPYVPPINTPTISSVSPAIGSLAGGTPITITGTNFSASTVTVGGVSCTSVVVVSATSITCTTGAHAVGAVNAVVTNADTQAATSTNAFTYLTFPSDVTGNKLWLDLSDTTKLYTDTGLTTLVSADGDTIKGLKDKGPLAYNFTEATNGPTYKVNIKNSRSIARFDGVNDKLTGATSIPAIMSVSAHTMWAVFQTAAISTGTGNYYNDNCIINDMGEAGGGNWCMYLDSVTPTAGFGYWMGSNKQVGDTIALSTFYIMQVRHESSVLYVKVNGNAEVNVATANNMSDITKKLLLGSEPLNATVNFTRMDLCELICYNVAVGASDRASILSYLNTKWAVY